MNLEGNQSIKKQVQNNFYLEINKLELDKKKAISSIFSQNKTLTKYDDKEYENIIYYPSSTKEWFNSVYSYNKVYIKTLLTTDLIINNLFKSYFNMFESKKSYGSAPIQKKKFKRRRANKRRYSANKIYVSKTEMKHTNLKVIMILYIYNKQKLLIERSMRKIVNFLFKKKKQQNNKKIIHKKNRTLYMLKTKFLFFKLWNIAFVKLNINILEDFFINIRKRYLNKISRYSIRLVKKLIRLEEVFFNYVKLLNFNTLKFSNFMLNIRGLGLINLIKKIYNKKVEIKIIELRSIHLNSDVFSSAVALKLRDRKNKAVRVLRKAILKMVKIPAFHSLLTSDDFMERINKNNILNVIKQQVVSGVRFEASGRLTRRLTALRSIFKYKYIGGLKNIRSSYNNKSSTMLRGYVKSNLQYTNINSKTRNGTFGLKGWVSSH